MSFEMIYNGIVLPIEVQEVGGRGPYTQQAIRKAVPGRNGAYYIKKRIPERPLPVKYLIKSQSEEDLRIKVDELSAILNVEGEVPITFTDEVDKTYFGVLDGDQNWDEIKKLGRGVLPIVRFDPYKYGSEKLITVTSGTPFDVLGNVEINPIIKVTFSASSPDIKITHQESGKYVRVKYSFSNLDILEIDLTRRKYKINGNLNMMAYDFNSIPFKLKPGVNHLIIESLGVSKTEITYRPGWS
ncbi:distal tail protein Dit [Rossellomorea sp. BNER]|uniref:distal tail protein Dit n=1 Tax=Rossellomorea sp. BNER TaxID=2962031 RepID=UPI003AF27F33|nr:phage tail family protein [Rossellomorea sp. BNER]